MQVILRGLIILVSVIALAFFAITVIRFAIAYIVWKIVVEMSAFLPITFLI